MLHFIINVSLLLTFLIILSLFLQFLCVALFSFNSLLYSSVFFISVFKLNVITLLFPLSLLQINSSCPFLPLEFYPQFLLITSLSLYTFGPIFYYFMNLNIYSFLVSSYVCTSPFLPYIPRCLLMLSNCSCLCAEGRVDSWGKKLGSFSLLSLLESLSPLSYINYREVKSSGLPTRLVVLPPTHSISLSFAHYICKFM